MNRKSVSLRILTAIAILVPWFLPVETSLGADSATEYAAIGAMKRLVAAPGLVEPISGTRQVAATVVGRIIKMSVDEGDHVAAGQVIAEIDNADLRAQLAAAKAAVEARQSELQKLEAGAREQERREAEAAVAEAQAETKLAGLTYQRREALGVKSIVSKESVDQARAGRDAALAREALQAEKLALLVAPPRAEDVAIAQANLASARAHVDEISAQLEKTIIRSPIDGVVLRRYRRAGESVTNLPPTPIVDVGDISRLRVRVDLDESDVGHVTVGEGAWITADAFGAKRFHGVVTKIGDALGPKTFRTDQPGERLDTKVLEVRVALDADVHLPVGLRVDVVFDPSAKKTAEAAPLRESDRALADSVPAVRAR
jgi:HlyD family secretion protein